MKENKKLMSIIAVIAIVVLAGVGLWWIMQNNKSVDVPKDTEEEIGQEIDEEVSLIGSTWSWEMFQDQSDENNIEVNDPNSYTIALSEDGTVNIQADCNQLAWTYVVEGSSLTFDSTGPSTLAFCGEDSLDAQFLENLGQTATYVIADGQLFLNLFADAGNMVFSQ